jgi:hypothetical protein
MQLIILTYHCSEEKINSMDKNTSWVANSSLASQEISHILWNLKVHCRAHNSPSLVRNLNKIKPFHTLPFYFFKIHFNIILISMPFPSGFLTVQQYAFL